MCIDRFSKFWVKQMRPVEPCRMMPSSVAAMDYSSRVADGAPDLVRRRRHLQVVNAKRLEGIIDGIHYRGKAADSTAFPGSFDAQGIGFLVLR